MSEKQKAKQAAAPHGKDDKGAKDKPAKGKDDKSAKGRDDKSAKGKEAAPHPETPSRPAEPPRLRIKYAQEIIPALTKQFGYKNPNQVPRLVKIVLNMGLGEAVSNAKIIDAAVEELAAIAGQKPVVTKAKKSIANFKLRTGAPIGAMVTLRRERMWEFADRLTAFALPRVRDFKGVSPKAFDGRGNYSLGIKEQIIFPEINYDKIDKIKGLNVVFVTTARNDVEAKALLAQLGMPFRQ